MDETEKLNEKAQSRKSTEPPRDTAWMPWLYGATGAALLALDIAMPSGIAAGVPYLALVLLGLWSSRRRDFLYLAAAASVLVVVGFLFSTGSGPLWVLSVNRGLALSAVWAVALVCVVRKRSEGLLHQAVESAPNAVLVVDRDGVIVLVNREAERMFGFDRRELIGRPVEVLVPARFRESHAGVGRSFLDAPTPRKMGSGRELLAVRKDGTEFPVEIGLSPVQTEDGPVVQAAVVDISVREEMEGRLQSMHEELERHAAELARSNEELSRFAYAASHDLKAPLRGIGSLAGWIEEDAGEHLPADSRNHLAQLRARVERMGRLLDDLLAYALVGRRRGQPEEIDTDATVREVFELIGRPGGFELAVQDDLPAVRADRAPFEQVFLNLIGNAVKHHDREVGRIEVSAEWTGDGVTFTVADDGPGIPPEHHDRIFGMFQTLGPHAEIEGSGMGLAMVKKIVETEGGAVRVESPGDRGTRFHVTWPQATVK